MAMDFCTIYGEPDCFDCAELDACFDAQVELAWQEFQREMDWKASDHQDHVATALAHHASSIHGAHVTAFILNEDDIPF